MPALRRFPLSSRAAFRIAPLLLAAGLLSACGNGDTAEPPARPVLVQQPTPAAGAVQAFAGEIRARHETPLAFRVGGKVAKRLVDVGDRVVAGQALAELDAQDLRLSRDAAQAQLTAAEADARLAAAEFERIEVMFQRQLVSRSLFDARKNGLDAANSRVAQARAQLDVAGNQAAYGVLRANASGVVAVRNIEAGQVVSAGQTAFGLAEDGEREVAIALPEADVARFKDGQDVLVELWAAPGQRVPGTIREIAPAADPQARTYATRVALALPEGVRVELGQSARVYAANAAAPSLSVPLSALVQADGQAAVWVLDADGQRVKRVPVDAGAYSETDVPVSSGLQPDDWVVISGVHLLRENDAVKPVDRENRPVRVEAQETPAVAEDASAALEAGADRLNAEIAG
ncbi:efflux RND transporter periplasmic adaptor subunit [Silanimonas sp.]|uniref:efflux RND transporter periplasmic adaptor subunit n=1 Tax=Silanimonas sp. TaxID=1929290 RepID=UPI0022C265B6|nr:efflux RND transporter periplasmic adaptor subunit [Silanimonas sp.]MCZ8165702.1 efflux RND transporter periplasmic adaptor subunit [Silanimonas sp.]